MRISSISIALLALVIPALAAAQAPQTQRVSGTIESVSSAALVVKTASGIETLALNTDTVVIAEIKGTIADVTPGSYVGATIEPQADGTLRSVEIHIFPAGARGANEGYFPMRGLA